MTNDLVDSEVISELSSWNIDNNTTTYSFNKIGINLFPTPGKDIINIGEGIYSAEFNQGINEYTAAAWNEIFYGC